MNGFNNQIKNNGPSSALLLYTDKKIPRLILFYAFSNIQVKPS